MPGTAKTDPRMAALRAMALMSTKSLIASGEHLHYGTPRASVCVTSMGLTQKSPLFWPTSAA